MVTILDSLALDFTFVMKDITIYLVDWARSLSILPKFLTLGTSILIFDTVHFSL